MHSTTKIFLAFVFVMPFLFGSSVLADEIDDTIPDVTARVARISFIRGDVQIRRLGSQDWEKAVLNLPVVEGDEITTDAGGRFEIQFNIYTHVRVAESSYLKIVGLQDGSIALSLPEGTLNARLTKFDSTTAFFEIDAPKTTVAVQQPGMYRVDAGKQADGLVRVTVNNDGEARVYSDNSGFTLKNGRTASVKIEGQLAGEWETADAGRFADEFDEWALDRDAMIAKRLKDANYDKYYDQDIYGADDLEAYGEWVHTKKYGYVWRPSRNSVSQYADWSPYRYGHWRWVPPYGWTWVNNEPWGWATYHHGRWIYDNGGWFWTPYGYYRNSRSWWWPALVGVTIINQNICWYPLPYNYGYYNYNYYYGNYGGGHHGGGSHGGGNNGGGHNGGNGGGPTPTPSPGGTPVTYPAGGPSVFANNDQRRAWFATPPMLRVPPTGVVSAPLSSFGRGTTGYTKAAPSDARNVLSKTLAINDPVRLLPTYRDLDGKISTSIRTEKPRSMSPSTRAETGAAPRKPDVPLGPGLQTTRVLGDRQPIQVRPETDGKGEPRKTGAVTRRTTPDQQDTQVRAEPARTPRQKDDSDPVRSAPSDTRTNRSKDDRPSEPVRQPRNDPPTRSEPTRSEPTRSEPTRSEPTRSEPTRSEPTRSEPTRSEPTRNDPPLRNDPPPQKSEPAPSKSNDSRPEPTRRTKDG